MVELRHFTYEDIDTIIMYQMPTRSPDEVKAIIDGWHTLRYDGKYFEPFAVTDNGEVVGYVSLFEHDSETVSEGVEIYEPFRRRGCAYDAVTALFPIAKARGYKRVTAQVSIYNAPSIALHAKLGMTKTGEYTNSKGKPVFGYEKQV